jgi:hypothetical protein
MNSYQVLIWYFCAILLTVTEFKMVASLSVPLFASRNSVDVLPVEGRGDTVGIVEIKKQRLKWIQGLR